MPEKISWSWVAQILGGTGLASSDKLNTVDGVTDAEVTVAAGTTRRCLVQYSAPSTSKVTFLALMADRYGDFKFQAEDSGGAKGSEIFLDAAQLLAGTDLARQLGRSPYYLHLTNTSATDPVTVQFLAGWVV